jgi:hypothetical protein
MGGLKMLFFEFVLPVLVPPVLGGIVGWIVGRQRPQRAVTAGIIGGAAGGWIGVGLYRLFYLPSVSSNPSLEVFSAYVLVGGIVEALVLVLVFSPRNRNQ